MAMVTGELIPPCQRLGLGRSPQRISTMGISMDGYGALLSAEKYPALIAAVAAISPAIWTSYTRARNADAGAYASAAAFAANDAVTHAASLAHVPVRVASGYDDPFYPGVQVLARAPGWRRHGLRQGLSHQPVLPGAGTAVAGIPRPPARELAELLWITVASQTLPVSEMNPRAHLLS